MTPSTTVRPTHFANFLSFNNGNYNASWMVNSGTGSIWVMVEVRATGWIAFGVANRAPNFMVGYDVAVGGVLSGSGQGYLQVNGSTPIVKLIAHALVL